jgi:hypothetical protein
MLFATEVTLTFDPNDLIDLYPASAGDEDVVGENKATQVNARRVHEVFGSTYYETFYEPANPHTQPNDYNTYMNWRDGLTGDTEGIAMFNNWFLGWSGAATWGETWVVKTDAPVSATAANGWQWREVREPYRVEEGACIQFWTTDPDNYIRNGGADLGEFSITVDLYEDTNANGMWDVDDVGVSVGDEIRMWFGNLNGDDAPFYRDDTQAVYFDDQGWGSRTPAASPFDAVYASGANNPVGSGFEAMLNVTAVPEPGTAALLIFGLAALCFGGVRRRKQ